jgi:hypothetical protein
MRFGLRLALVAVAMTAGGLGSSAAWAGDDGQAPLWEGISSIFSWSWGGGGGDKDPIEYREHGKIVVPPNMDLPPPGQSPTADASWPVNQEGQRKKAAKDAQKTIAGVGDARLRYTKPFPPNTPVTVRPTDDQLPAANATANGATSTAASAALPNLSLNPLNWVGVGKSVPLGPEPQREWLTDPPQGFRAPVGQTQTQTPTQGSAAN